MCTCRQNEVSFLSDFHDRKKGPAQSIKLSYTSSESWHLLGAVVVVGLTDVVGVTKQSAGSNAKLSVVCMLRLWFWMKIARSDSSQVMLYSLPISAITQTEKFSISLNPKNLLQIRNTKKRKRFVLLFIITSAEVVQNDKPAEPIKRGTFIDQLLIHRIHTEQPFSKQCHAVMAGRGLFSSDWSHYSCILFWWDVTCDNNGYDNVRTHQT